MKKTVIKLLAAFTLAILIPFRAYATEGFSVSTSDITLHPGESTSFTITASNSAGKIDISSSDTDIASVSANSIFLDLNSQDITVTAGGLGSATISVTASSEFATYDEEILEGESYDIVVNVVEESQPGDSPGEPGTKEDGPGEPGAKEDSPGEQETQDDESTEDIMNIPNTGSNSQGGSGSTPIIFSSIIGGAVAILSFAAIYLYKKSH